MKVDRRSFLKVIGGVTLMGVLAGCGGDASGGGNNDPGNSGGAGSDVGGGNSDNEGTPGGNEPEKDPDNKKESGFYAAEQADAAGVRWTYYYDANSNTAALAGYKESGAQPSGKVTLPSMLDGIKVTSVRYCAFYTEPRSMQSEFETRPEGRGYTRSDFSMVTEMIVPESITWIGQQAFDACVNTGVGTESSKTILKKVTFLGKVRLGLGVFHYCEKLKEIVGAEKVQCDPHPISNVYCFENNGFEQLTVYKGMMAESNFAGCDQLKKIWIEDGVTEILQSAFNECLAMESIYIPASVKKIEKYAFNRYGKPTPSLKDIYFGGTQAEWDELKRNTEDGNVGLTGATSATIHFGAKMTDMK